VDNVDTEFLIRNEVIDMPKMEMPKSAKFIFYTALREKALKQIGSEINSSVVVNYSQMKNVFKGNKTFNEMIMIILKIPKEITFKSNGKIISISMFTKYVIDDKEKEIIFNFNEEALKYFNIDDGKFSKIILDELYSMKSDYSIRMYEFACRYSGKIKMKLDTFKKYFNIPNTYQIKNINQKVLNKAIPEVNHNTRFMLEVKEYKKGKTVTHIEITIKEDVKKAG